MALQALRDGLCHQAPVGQSTHKGPGQSQDRGRKMCRTRTDGVNHAEKSTSCCKLPIKPGQTMSQEISWAAFGEAPSPKSQPMKRFILCSPVLTKDKPRPTQCGQMNSSIFSEQQSNFLPILKSPQFPNRPLWGSCRN